MVQKHYQLLDKMSVDSVFDARRKEEAEDRISGFGSLSVEAGDAFLDKEIEKGEGVI